MLLAVVDELDHGAGLLFAIDDHANRLGDSLSGPLHGDVVEGVAMAVVKLERLPGARQPRTHPQLVRFEPKTEQRLTISRYIQPADPVYQLQPPRPVCGATE